MTRPTSSTTMRHPRIVEAPLEDRRQRTARPVDDLGHQFGHRDPRIGGHDRQRSAQGEAHAQPADQHMSVPVAGDASPSSALRDPASEPLMRLFISGLVPAMMTNFVAALHQPQRCALAGDVCRAQQRPWPHDAPSRRLRPPRSPSA